MLAWVGVTGLWIAWGPRGFLPLLLVAGVYLVGPLWVAVRYRVDAAGIERATAFGRRTWSWREIASYRIDAAERAAWLAVRGRGSARFLPPILLLWEPGEPAGFAAALEARLAAGLARAAGEEAG